MTDTETSDWVLVPVEPVDTIHEERCHYCGDSSYDAHPCRAGGHDFRSTGRTFYVYEESPLYSASALQSLKAENATLKREIAELREAKP